MSSSIKGYRGATPAERKRIKAAVLSEYRGRVGALVRRRLSSDHWEEAEQVGLIGVLVALDRYEPEKNDAFWPYAVLWVRREIQRWLDHAVYWRPTTNKARLSRTALAHRHHTSMDAALPGGDTLHDLVVTRAPSAEELLSEAELTARLRRFAATLSADERVILFAENGGRFPSRQYLNLVERATKFVKADPSNAPVIRAKNANSSARARRKRAHKTS